MEKFDYKIFTTRNIGFVTEAEQDRLKHSRVFVAGTGGMGGAALNMLVRMGIQNFIIADIDVFEVSNLNRQIFSTMDTVGKEKSLTTKEQLLKINPSCSVTLYDGSWIDKLSEILPQVDIVINGCDDIKATLELMRTAKVYNKTVIDAFASPLPSVYVVKPKDPRPEETFGYPSFGKEIKDLSAEEVADCLAKEIEYVLVHSSSANHVVLEIAAEMMTGKRKRISFAPMVTTTGCLMSYEVVKFLLNKKTATSFRGVFFNPWEMRCERPFGKVMGLIRAIIVKIFLKRLL